SVGPARDHGRAPHVRRGLPGAAAPGSPPGRAPPPRPPPPLAIGGAPFMFRDFDHWKKYSQSPLLQELEDGYFKKGGNKPLAVTYYGVRHTTANKPINVPDDMKGLKLRVPDAPLYVMYPKVVGANATPIAFAEV